MGGKSLLLVCLTFTLTFANRIALPKASEEDCWYWNDFCSTATDGTLKPNPKECGSFCECAPGGPVMLKCPLGLHFSVATNKCEQPWNAGCKQDLKVLISTQHHHHARNCDKQIGECKKSPVGTFLRNPGDCGSYCRCDGTTAVWMPCPVGLHFSLSTNKCEYPGVAGCIPAPTSGPSPTHPPPPPPVDDCSAVAADCKASPVGTLLRNPSDCGSFCQCAAWGPVKMDCPAGLHFSVSANRCEWPSIAGCIPGPPMPNHHGCELVEYMCPKNNIGNVMLLRNPLDCESYCACDWGKSNLDALSRWTAFQQMAASMRLAGSCRLLICSPQMPSEQLPPNYRKTK
ncbi:hypothetical protein J437_LFUL009230 [Ladona fulva]|uniref:Chitin-binding type-2 domain-containing protein n=1 Tax=Ladona fulva TaxID=123851 RepID=A0A8K0NYI9_LADFU|nr:hypothetical protein J437_LFUL009230 [Ladona fulva]